MSKSIDQTTETERNSNSDVAIKRRPLSRRRRLAFAIVATVLVVGLLSALDHAAGYFLFQEPPQSLLFPSGSRVEHVSSEFSVSIATSNAGIRDHDFKAGTPPDGTTRIVAVGDSFTFGWGVAIEESWPKVLERELAAKQAKPKPSAIEVLNFGYPGASPIDYERASSLGLKHFQPHVLVIGILQGDDLIQLYDQQEKPIWSWSQLPGQMFPTTCLLVKQRPNPSPMQSYRELFRSSNQFVRSQFDATQRQHYQSLPVEVRMAFETGLLNPSLIQTAMRRPHYFNAPLTSDAAWRKTVSQRLEHILDQIGKKCDSADCQLIVAIIPNGPYVSHASWNGMREIGYSLDEELLSSDRPNELVHETCDRLEIECVDVTEEFRQQDADLYFKWDGHFNIAGQKMFGELLAKQLRRHIP